MDNAVRGKIPILSPMLGRVTSQPRSLARNSEKPPHGRSRIRELDFGAEAVMLYKLGRVLQLIGLILLPLAMAGNLVPGAPVGLSGMLELMVLGAVIFFIGWVVQQIGKGK
jgi:hypothetical protein